MRTRNARRRVLVLFLMDDRTQEQRSKTMAAVKSQNTRFERTFLSELPPQILRGIEQHPGDVPGKPDLAHRRRKVAIFLDSCFWHGCHKHLRMPSSNRTYWTRKIAGNRARDLRVSKELRESGWLVMRVWEHSLKTSRSKKWWRTRIVNQLSLRAPFRVSVPAQR